MDYSICHWRFWTVLCGKPGKRIEPTDDPLDSTALCAEHLKTYNAMRKDAGMPKLKPVAA